MGVHSVIQFDTIADMKAFDVSSWSTGSLMSSALLVDCATVGDERGGLYRWSPDSTATELYDGYFNVISSSTTPSGRWLRVFQRVIIYPQGVMTKIGPVKTMIINGVTDVNGQVTVNLTSDNTATGPSLYAEIWKVFGYAKGSVSSLANAPNFFVKTYPDASNNFKQAVLQFYKPSSPTTIVAGLIPLSIVPIDANFNVSIEIIGT